MKMMMVVMIMVTMEGNRDRAQDCVIPGAWGG